MIRVLLGPNNCMTFDANIIAYPSGIFFRLQLGMLSSVSEVSCCNSSGGKPLEKSHPSKSRIFNLGKSSLRNICHNHIHSFRSLSSFSFWVVDIASGVSFLYNADVMTSALFGTSKNSKLSFPATCTYFGKVFQLRNTSIFHFHGFQPVSKDSLHVAMCTNSKGSDYALMIQF